MQVVFLGTPELAVPTLRLLAAQPGMRPAAVFTQPPARRSRRGHLEPSPVGEAARRLGLEVHDVESVNSGPALDRLRAIAPDVIVVVAFGQILKRAVLQIPRHGCINLHPSLLPRYRGAAPIQRAVMDGIVESGITVMRLVRKLDAGPILMQRPWRMDPEKTAEELLAEAGQTGAAMMLETLRAIETIRPVEQDDALTSLAPMLTRQDGELDFTRAAVELHNRVRAVQPWPRASCMLELAGGNKRLIVHRSSLAAGSGEAGVVLGVDQAGIVVACGDGALRIAHAQLEGKPALPARDVANGLRLKPGARLAAYRHG